MEESILKLTGIEKQFPGVKALNGVSLEVERGCVHALMGENGAGKSTLMKILTGIYTADKGNIFFKGELVHVNNPHHAMSLGISMIHQELNPVTEMTVGDNLFLGREPINKITRLVDSKQIFQSTKNLLAKLGVTGIAPGMRMKDLSVAQMQMVEIVKAVSFNAELIIMDEPTSAISVAEVETLFRIIRSLKEKEISIIYISHKLDEVFSISDKVTVLRDGAYIGTEDTEKLNKDKLIRMMVGRDLSDLFHKEKIITKEVFFELKDFTNEKYFKNINLKVHRGEILGLAGLMGAGRTEIVETIFGMRGQYQGEIYKNGKQINISSPGDAIRNKIALVPEDRKTLGLFLGLSIKENISIAWLKKFSKLLWIITRRENVQCRELAGKLKLKVTDLNRITNTLSGGNQQKVVLAKWLMTVPDVLIFDEPTRGIDVGAKAEFYNIMVGLAREGKAIIMISSEMRELLGMSDRILVVHDGRITGELASCEATQEKVLELACQ